MNYIVFDLEWNQCSGGRVNENPRMPFEIIEIGAVKLDTHYNLIDTYSSIVKPRLYKKLQTHIRAILNYDEVTLRKGRPFDMVCREFLKWCGDDYIFGTWGSMDLNYLQNNMEYYYMNPYSTPQKYYNIQQIYADLIDKNNKIVKLETAVEHMNITVDRPFHSAVNDAYYTGMVLKLINPKDIKDRYCFDVYNAPKDVEDEITSYHKHYMEHISREFDSKQDAMQDKELVAIQCYSCKKKTSKKLKWFASSTNTFLCVCKCWYHGLQVGRLKFRTTKAGKVFVIKTIYSSNKKELEDLKERQNDLRLKRQQKRHEKNSRNSSTDLIEDIDIIDND